MTHSRTTTYQPALAWFAALGAAWVFGVVTLGAFTTSIHAGMAFPDWPLSNGSINPEGWLTEVDKFAEHSHRLFGMVMGFLAITLAVWLQLREPRFWVRKLGWSALAIVIIQGILGGKRVLLDSIDVPGFEMSLGQMLRIPHGILAQVYVCVLFAIAAGLSRRWIETPVAPITPSASGARSPSGAPADIGCKIRLLGSIATLLVIVQLIVAAVMRHNNAGLAIPSFPASSTDGGILPVAWDFRIAIHFTHRVLAVVLTGVLGWLAVALWRSPAASRGFNFAAGLIVALVAGQITLGAITVLTFRNPYYTTAHVIGGAFILATVFTVTWWAHRNVIERPATLPASA